ncbi:TetR family transcriptional regulator [Shinella daejeonensis]|uniref:TetR family transcriptional regulator n=1 Tax=Shinella daejeonensis TaxID=659017 RepID=UPI0020C76965|nr:TetR family transcriptional regulator [Shinella daejeonensis]MCP8893778.1 TetR family transcriptional regulator [Shinella daejeonensis]
MRRSKARARETRQQILLAAERVFYEKGVANASMEEVARAAGVTRGAIYWHFANRSELFMALCNSVPLPQEDLLARGLEAPETDALALMERLVGEWIELLSRDEQRQRILSILLRCDYGGEFADVCTRQHDIDDRHMLALETVFARALEQGRMNRIWTPQSAASTLRWMIKGLCAEWLLFGRRFDIVAEGREGVSRLFRSFALGQILESDRDGCPGGR